jgi:hypothetical protein
MGIKIPPVPVLEEGDREESPFLTYNNLFDPVSVIKEVLSL